MQLHTIDMPQEEAEAALREWEAELSRSRSDEDAAIAEGYRELARGSRLLRMSDTIRAGGEDDSYKPRLALAPVTATTIYLTRWRNGTVRYSVSDRPAGGWKRDVTQSGVIVRDVLSGVPDRWQDDDAAERFRAARVDEQYSGCQWRALVPVVPPRFRAWGWRGAHVLFEAEWARHTPPAPIDPALVRHLRGDLWVVMGVWDLTELERAVLTQRNDES